MSTPTSATVAQQNQIKLDAIMSQMAVIQTISEALSHPGVNIQTERVALQAVAAAVQQDIAALQTNNVVVSAFDAQFRAMNDGKAAMDSLKTSMDIQHEEILQNKVDFDAHFAVLTNSWPK